MRTAYEAAKEKYSKLGVDVDDGIRQLQQIPLSIHCWQADDVGGFEHPDAQLQGGGIQVIGNYPGKPRNISEFRTDLEKVYSLIPGTHRLSLHASYADFPDTWVDRDQIEPRHFDSWLEWGQAHGLMLDFNATLFSHPKAEDGFTLSSRDSHIRKFWIAHVIQARKIAAYFGEKQGSPSIHNIWIPDGSKDLPVNRHVYRELLRDSLDEVFTLALSKTHVKDAVESKLFGIGSEAFVVGSHEFYLGYSLTRDILLCLDMGHFHPTESVADKISSYFQFQNELLLHVSRPLRWDSDHVVIFNDDVRQLMEELVRADVLHNTHIGLDFFDATLNRIGAYAIGARSALKGLLAALLEPYELLKKYDEEGNFFARLALLEESKLLPLGEIWDEYCRTASVPTDAQLIREVMNYEHAVLLKRD